MSGELIVPRFSSPLSLAPKNVSTMPLALRGRRRRRAGAVPAKSPVAVQAP